VLFRSPKTPKPQNPFFLVGLVNKIKMKRIVVKYTSDGIGRDTYITQSVGTSPSQRRFNPRVGFQFKSPPTQLFSTFKPKSHSVYRKPVERYWGDGNGRDAFMLYEINKSRYGPSKAHMFNELDEK